MNQKVIDFDLDPKLAAIDRLDETPAVKKLLRGLAIYGCSHPSEVILGSGGEDGEWLLAPGRKELAACANVDVSTLKRWLGSGEVAVSRSVWVRRNHGDRNEFVVYWSHVFGPEPVKCAPAKIPTCAGAQSEECAPAQSANAPGRKVQMRPGASPGFAPGEGEEIEDPLFKPTNADLEQNHHHTTKQTAKGDLEVKRPASLGITINAIDLKQSAGAWKIFQAAVRVGVLAPDDALVCCAFLFWVHRQPSEPTKPGHIRNKPGFIVDCLTQQPREHWALRAEPDDYKAARRIVDEFAPGV